MQVAASITNAATRATARIAAPSWAIGTHDRCQNLSVPSVIPSVADSTRSAVSTMPTRTRVLQTPLAAVDHLQSPGARDDVRPERFSPEFQICFPYSGLFVWHVG